MHRPRDLIDEPSRLRQFSWEQWDDQFIAVLFRPGRCGLDRYVVKSYVEHVLFQSQRWKHLSLYFGNISAPVPAFRLTVHEAQLIRDILKNHLDRKLTLNFTQSNDQLIGYEDLLDFISRAQELASSNAHPLNDNENRNGKPPSIPSTLSSTATHSLTKPPTSLPPSPLQLQSNHNRMTPPTQLSKSRGLTAGTNVAHIAATSAPAELHPESFANAPIDGSGWVQINNVYLPFIVKKHQRLVPHQILVACKILDPHELRQVLIRASSAEVTLINSMIQDCKINNERIPHNALLINVRHVLIGTRNLVYIKLLPRESPTSKINRQYKTVLASHGGSLRIATRLVPFVCASNHTYLPLDDLLDIYPNLYTQLKAFVRVPRTNELDYLQLVQMYSDGKELPSDALVIDMKNLKEVQIIPSRTMTLMEHHAREKGKLEQQIRLLPSAPTTKRKHSETQETRQVQHILKSPKHFRPIPTTGYFPAPAMHPQVSQSHSLNNGQGGRAH